MYAPPRYLPRFAPAGCRCVLPLGHGVLLALNGVPISLARFTHARILDGAIHYSVEIQRLLPNLHPSRFWSL